MDIDNFVERYYWKVVKIVGNQPGISDTDGMVADILLKTYNRIKERDNAEPAEVLALIRQYAEFYTEKERHETR